MDLRKPFFFEHFFSSLSFKRRVVSGFGVGVVASLLVVSLLVSVNTPSTTSSSLFSWFFSVPEVVSESESQKSVDYLLGVEKTHDGNSSKSSFSERESDLGNAHFKNLTGDVKNSSGLVNGEPVLEKTHDEKNSSRSSFSGKESDVSNAHFKNSTEDAKNSSGLVNQEPVLENTHEGNFSRSDVRGPAGRGEVIAKTHMENITKDDAKTVFKKKDGVEGKDLGTKGFNTVGKNVSRDSGEGRDIDRIKEDKSKNNGSGSTKATGECFQKCNIFNGRWVRDERKPYYPAGSCPYIDNDFNCYKNGRPDDEFLRWKWQPNDCNIPSLNATDFLARLRGKRLIFVGDSLNRNMWESLVCILRHSVKRKSRVYEVSGRNEFKTKGYYSFRFEDYKCSVDFVRSPFLVRELYLKNSNGSEDEKLRLDLLDETTAAYLQADIIVFNTGHWWTHEKTSRGIDYYQEGDYVHPVLKVMEAYKKALTTWAKWVDKNINSNKTQVVFRGYSLTHFRGGQWNSGGQCHKETDPIFNDAFLAKYPSKMRALERVLEQMKTPVIYLNISKLTDYRKDGHPSIYRKKYDTLEEQIVAERSQDCSHWCLPGIPDTWNELLYASLLMGGKGSWRRRN